MNFTGLPQDNQPNIKISTRESTKPKIQNWYEENNDYYIRNN